MPEAMFPVPNPASRSRESKMREYKARIIQVEHGDFTPLVFTTSGGMGPQCERALKQLTERMAEKRELPMSVVAGWLRCRFSFALLGTSLICLRGTRRRKIVSKPNVELAVHEARIASLSLPFLVSTCSLP